MNYFDFCEQSFVMYGPELFKKISADTGITQDIIAANVGCEYYYETGYNYWSYEMIRLKIEETDNPMVKVIFEQILEYIENGFLPMYFYVLCGYFTF